MQRINHLVEYCQSMKEADCSHQEQMQQLIDTEEKDGSIQLFTWKTYKSLTKVGSEEMVQQLNLQSVRIKAPHFPTKATETRHRYNR